MGAYKQFLTSDLITTPLKVHKEFTFQGSSSLNTASIGRFLGNNIYQFDFNFINFHILDDSLESLFSIGGYDRTNIPFSLNVTQYKDESFIISANAHDDYVDKKSNWLYRATLGSLGQFWATIALVELMDLAFSIDNVFAAVAFGAATFAAAALAPLLATLCGLLTPKEPLNLFPLAVFLSPLPIFLFFVNC
jgi:hypothetical protein